MQLTLANDRPLHPPCAPLGFFCPSWHLLAAPSLHRLRYAAGNLPCLLFQVYLTQHESTSEPRLLSVILASTTRLMWSLGLLLRFRTCCRTPRESTVESEVLVPSLWVRTTLLTSCSASLRFLRTSVVVSTHKTSFTKSCNVTPSLERHVNNLSIKREVSTSK